MPAPPNKLAKAQFKEITWDTEGQVQEVDDPFEFEVQFNPESLKLSYNSTKAGGDQSGGSAIQYVGQGTTKLSLDLIFDGSRDERAAEGGNKPDVRLLTLEIINFITPKEAEDDTEKLVAPGLRISWGSFLFEGIVDSVSETLDFWTEDGRPLQAKVSVSLSKQEVQVQPPQGFAGDGDSAAGTTPMSPAREGDSVASMAGRNGDAAGWKDVAAGNGIENPRDLGAGALLDLKAGVSIGANASLGISAEVGVSSGVGLSGGVSGGASASFGIGAGVAASASAPVSAAASLSSKSASGSSSSTSLSSRLTSRSAGDPQFSFKLESG